MNLQQIDARIEAAYRAGDHRQVRELKNLRREHRDAAAQNTRQRKADHRLGGFHENCTGSYRNHGPIV